MKRVTEYSPKKSWKRNLACTAIAAASLVLSGCVSTGKGGTAVSGAAAGSQGLDANSSLEHCEQTLGTIAIDDGRDSEWWGHFLRETNVTTVEPLIRLAVQQSNCFVITSIGNLRTDDRMSRITDIQRNSGEYREGSKQHKGQRVAADYFLEPRIIIDNSSIGGVAGTLGGLVGSNVGLLASGLDVKSSVVTLSLFDIRSAIQISASEGSATSTNYGAALGMLGGDAYGSLGGFTRTPEGKAVVAAFLDSYNGMVRSLKQYKAQDVQGGLGRGGLLKVN